MDALAKINLFLDVIGKRSDGYHNIISIMQTVSLRDELTITHRESGISLTCNDPTIPTDENNLVVKAARAMQREFGIRNGFSLELKKRIPAGAGLAGGSSNAAAAIRGINDLCGINAPLARLLEIGNTIGADVPFCLTGGTALTEGTGEIITELPPLPDCAILIICPKIHVSTGEIFSRLGKIAPCGGVEAMLRGVREKNLHEICASLYNVFAPITASLFPEISEIVAQLEKLGAIGAQMSGTGSAVFGIFDDEKSALRAMNIINSKYKTFLCKPQIFSRRNGI